MDVGEAGEAAVAAEVCWAVEADEAAVAAKVCWAVEAEADRVARTACMAGRRGPGGVSCMALPNTIQPTAALVLVVGGVVGWLSAWGMVGAVAAASEASAVLLASDALIVASIAAMLVDDMGRPFSPK